MRTPNLLELIICFAGIVVLPVVWLPAKKTQKRNHKEKQATKPSRVRLASEILLPATAALFLFLRNVIGVRSIPGAVELGIMLATIIFYAALHIPIRREKKTSKKGENREDNTRDSGDASQGGGDNRRGNPLREWLPAEVLLLLTALVLYLLERGLSTEESSFLSLFYTGALSFTSFLFYLFVAYTVLLYYLVPKRAQWLVAMLASIAFYATYGVERLPFILASSLIAYFAARKMDKLQRETEDKAEAKKKCKPVLVLALIGLVGLLLYAKIGTWVMQTVGAALKIGGAETAKAIVALGVSYYTFSLISYVADVYWRKDTAETNYLHLLAFTIYFPKILQGPISRHKELAPQMFEEHRFDYEKFCFGVQRMLWGYFKKLVIADRLAIFVNTVFGNIEGETGVHLLVAAVFGAVQLYCDFSGCMDIALGFSECLGLKLAENFDHPFFSRSAAEFWRRWHITLGTWFKDYVYMPLVISPKLIALSKSIKDKVGNRAGKAVMTVIPLTVVWLLTGLWHSTGWNYVVWGLYWGALIVCSTVFAPEYKKLAALLRISTETGSWKLFQMVRTFFLFVIGRILTIPGNLAKSVEVFHKIIAEFHMEGFFDGSLYTLGLDRPNFLLGIVCIFVLWSASMLQRQGSVRERIAASNLVFRWIIYYIGFFSIIIFGIYGPGYDASSFVYMQF